MSFFGYLVNLVNSFRKPRQIIDLEIGSFVWSHFMIIRNSINILVLKYHGMENGDEFQMYYYRRWHSDVHRRKMIRYGSDVDNNSGVIYNEGYQLVLKSAPKRFCDTQPYSALLRSSGYSFNEITLIYSMNKFPWLRDCCQSLNLLISFRF